MSQPIISIENLGKRYLVGHQAAPRERYQTLRDTVVRNTRDLWRKTADVLRGRQLVAGDTVEEFWALKNVSFEVKQGEVVGIIGRNGAGKSTLLKILSRITEPTEGRVTLRGRVASLLEVGTGFHPELTGRENVYLNGAILGMSRAEIRKKFDEIVTFAEVEKFLDTPVKRYSSGMYVRLAFAVAAHLEPEILIVDEVLAVGDAEFQKKCLGKMDQVASEGRTVLFVSHNMPSLQMLCSRAVLLEHGGVSMNGAVTQVVRKYLQQTKRMSAVGIAARTDRRGTGRARIVNVCITSGLRDVPLITGQPARFEFESDGMVPKAFCCFTIYNQTGGALLHFNSSLSSPADHRIGGTERRWTCELEHLPLIHGSYRLNLALIADGETLDHVEAACDFDVEAGPINGRLHRDRGGNCDICVPHCWTSPMG